METIISMIIIGIVGTLLVPIIGSGTKVLESALVNQEIKDNLYIAQRRFNHDVMGIRDIAHIHYADKTTLRFVNSDLDTIQYRYDGGKFYRSENSQGEYTVAQYLTDSTRFFYYTINDVMINEEILGDSTLLKIWRIQLDTYATMHSKSMKIQSLSFPPNLKYGLVREF